MSLRNIAGSFVIFYVLVMLVVTAWSGFQVGYEVTEENLQDGKSIFEKLSGLSFINGVNQLTIGAQKLSRYGGTDFDITGGLIASGTGILQVIGGIVLFPFEITALMSGFYDGVVPPVISNFLGIAVVLTVAFIILSVKLGKDV